VFNPFQLLGELRINVSTRETQRSLRGLNNEIDRGTQKAKSFADAITFRGRSFAAFVVASTAVTKLTLALSKGFSEAISFEKELGRIAQTTDKTLGGLKLLSNQLRQVSVDTAVSSTKIAELTRIFAQTGLKLRDAAKAAKEVARTDILATFTNLNSTAEGAVAILSQFKLSVNDLDDALGAINVTSKKSAVEADNLIDAVKRAGGVFGALGGDLNEFLAIFTTVRETTRESSEAIATGLRTIFSRLQRRSTLDFFRTLDIELTDLNGKIKEPFQAIEEIGKGLERLGIASGTVRFAEVVEQLGGIRQASRVIPILTELAKTEQNYKDILEGEISINKDLEVQRETLAFRLDQLRQKFNQLVGEVVDSDSFQRLIDFFITGAEAVIAFTRAVKELIPILIALFTLRIGVSVGSLLTKGGGLGGLGSGRGNFAQGFNSGGFVPGKGNQDTVPAMLTPGEFVINARSAKRIGYGQLMRMNKMNSGGIVEPAEKISVFQGGVKKFNQGGVVQGLVTAAGDTLRESKATDITDSAGALVNFALFATITQKATLVTGNLLKGFNNLNKRAGAYAKQFRDSERLVRAEAAQRKLLIRRNEARIYELQDKKIASRTASTSLGGLSLKEARLKNTRRFVDLINARTELQRRLYKPANKREAADIDLTRSKLAKVQTLINDNKVERRRIERLPAAFSAREQENLTRRLAYNARLKSGDPLTPRSRRARSIIRRPGRSGSRFRNFAKIALGADVTGAAGAGPASFGSGILLPALATAAVASVPFAGVQRQTQTQLDRAISLGDTENALKANEVNTEQKRQVAGVGLATAGAGVIAGGIAAAFGVALAPLIAIVATVGLAAGALVANFKSVRDTFLGALDAVFDFVDYVTVGFINIETFSEAAARAAAETKAVTDANEAKIASDDATEKVIKQINERLISSFAELNVAVQKATNIALIGDLASQIVSGSIRSNIGERAQTGDRNAIISAGNITGAFGAAKDALAFSDAIADIREASRQQNLNQIDADTFAERVTAAATGAGITEGADLISIQQEGIEGIIKTLEQRLAEVGSELFGSSSKVENAFGQYIDILNKGTEAQIRYNEGLLSAADEINKQQAFFEQAGVFGTNRRDLRDRAREQPLDSRALRQAAIALASQRSVLGQDSLTGGGDINATSQFNAASVLLKRQSELLRLDNKIRSQLIETLQDQLAIESQRANNINNLGRDVVFGDRDERRNASRIFDIASDVQRAFESGGTTSAISLLQAATRSSGEAGSVLGVLDNETRRRIERRTPRAAGREVGGAFGRELDTIARTGFTELGNQIAKSIGEQFREINQNRDTLNQIEAENLKLIGNSAQILQQSLGNLDALLGGFNDRLQGIVDSLNNASIRMTLDNSNIVVTINEPEGLRNLEEGVKRSVIAEVGRNLQFGDPTDFN
jgi:TP901 family phage tail tape measure protein